jgi:hypothetical protein
MILTKKVFGILKCRISLTQTKLLLKIKRRKPYKGLSSFKNSDWNVKKKPLHK